MRNTRPKQIEVDLKDMRDRIEILLAQIGNQRIRDLHGKPLKVLLTKLDKHVAGIPSH
jgi:hypothetical protein